MEQSAHRGQGRIYPMPPAPLWGCTIQAFSILSNLVFIRVIVVFACFSLKLLFYGLVYSSLLLLRPDGKENAFRRSLNMESCISVAVRCTG